MYSYTCEYHDLLKEQKVAPERMGGRVMCMDMFTRIFSVCRVPGDPADEIHVSFLSHRELESNDCSATIHQRFDTLLYFVETLLFRFKFMIKSLIS